MAKLGDEIDVGSSSDDSDYIVLKSGRKVRRGDMSDSEWSAFVADAEKQGKLKLESTKDDVVENVQLPTVESVKAAMAAKKNKASTDTSDLPAETRTVKEVLDEEDEKAADKPAPREGKVAKKSEAKLDTSDLPAETRTVEQAGDEEAAKAEAKPKAQKRAREPKVEIAVGELQTEEPPAPPPPLEDEDAQPPAPEPLEKQKSWVGYIKDADGGVKQQEMSDEMVASAPGIYGDQFLGHAPKNAKSGQFFPASKSEVPSRTSDERAATALARGGGWRNAPSPVALGEALNPDAPAPAVDFSGVQAYASNPPAFAQPGGVPMTPANAMAAVAASPGAVPPPPGAVSNSVRVSGRTGGGGGLRPAVAGTEGMDRASELANKMHDDVVALAGTQAEEIKGAAGELKAARIKAFKDSNDIAMLEKQAMQTMMHEQDKRHTAHQEALEEVRRVSAQGVDPGRFWNNKDAGQKAAAVIAGALFGFTGQGMQWLQRLDNLVAEDVRQQEGDLSRRIGGLKEYAAGQLTLADRARQRGIDTLSMLSIDKMQRLEEVKMHMENMATTMQNAEAQARLQGMIQGVEQLQMNQANKLQDRADLAAREQNDFNLRKAQMEQQAYQFSETQKTRGAGGGNGPKMAPGQVQRFTEIATAASQIKDIWKDWNRLATSAIPGKPGLTSVAPAAWSDSALWDKKKRGIYTQAVGPGLEGGKLVEAEYQRYKDDFIPGATDTERVAREKVDALIKNATSKYEAEYNTARATNAEGWQNLPTPAQFEADLRSQTFPDPTGQAAPTYATKK